MTEPRYGAQSPLDVRYESDGTWTVLKPIRYLSALTQKAYTIEEGFHWDGASVPRIPIAYLLAGNTAFLASLWHDYLYQTGLEPKDVADELFAEIMDMTHEPKWRRALMLTGVRVFGASHYRDEDGQMKAGFELPMTAAAGD